MTHPYLYFSKADAEAYFAERRKRSDWNAYYARVCEAAEKALCEELVTETAAKGNTVSQHADYGLLNGQANRFFSTLGVKYLADGDIRCAERMKEMLLSFIRFERWHSDSYYKRIPVPWHADIVSTNTSLATAAVYDLIFDHLNEDERRLIADGILEKGVMPALRDWILPETRIHALDSMGHNWWAVCVGEAATAFLCVSDFVPEQERKRITDLADRALAEYFEYSGNSVFNKIRSFDAEGLFYEGPSYNNYGTGTLLRYLFCSERYNGRNDLIRAAVPEKLSDAFMLQSYPYTVDGRVEFAFLNFGDSDFVRSMDAISQYACATGTDSPALRALASKLGSDTVSEIRGFCPEKLSGGVGYLPKTEVFPSGVALCRSSWDADATLFAVRAGACWNHSHNDSGSFVIYHKGKPLFTDSGTCSYESPLYHAYYCQDQAHSTVLVGGRGRRDEELYRGTKFPAQITDSFSTDGLFFVQVDCAGPMAHLVSRLFRNFIWIENRILVVFDEIFSHEEENVQFTLHYDGGYSLENGSVIISNDRAKARFKTIYPENTEIYTKIGHDDHKETIPREYLVVSTKDKLRTNCMIHTIELDPDGHDTVAERLTGENQIGVRITDADREYDIIFNTYADGHVMHDNTNNVIAGYDTDAYMLVITRNKTQQKEKALVVCGSYLRRGGDALFSSFTKKTVETEI